MSNINNFLRYREGCFNCDQKLNFKFISRVGQNIKYVDKDLRIEIEIDNFPKKKKNYSHSFILYINMENSEFRVEFLDRKKQLLSYVPFVRITSCLNYLNSTQKYFIKTCPSSACGYYYRSSNLNFNYSKSIVEFTSLYLEQVDIEKYSITNNYCNKISSLIYNYNLFEFPIIPLTTREGLIEKIKLSLTFS